MKTILLIFCLCVATADVDFLYIGAEMNGKVAEVKWTATCDESGVFSVQRSADAISFTTIGEVKSSETNEYKLTDKEPLSGVFYYRIRFASGKQAWVSDVIPIKNF